MAEALGKLYTEFLEIMRVQRVDEPRFEVEYAQNEVPLTLDRGRPLNQTGVTDGLGENIDAGLRLLNLHPEAVTLEWAGKELLLRSKEWQVGANLEVELTFISEDVIDYLQLEQKVFKFPLYDAKTYVLHPREEGGEDALVSEYPLSLVSAGGVSGATNYIEDLGWVSVLGYAKDRENFIGDGLVLESPYQQLSLRFIGKDLKTIVRQDRLRLFLTLHLEPLLQ